MQNMFGIFSNDCFFTSFRFFSDFYPTLAGLNFFEYNILRLVEIQLSMVGLVS